MATASPPDNTFIQTIITAFTEHPEALKALLDNAPINAALSAYLDAAAQRLRPEQKWREIYTLRSADKRLYAIPDNWRYAMMDGVRQLEVVAKLSLHYDNHMRIAVLFVGLTDATIDFASDHGMRLLPPTVMKRVESFEEQADAIHWAQALFPELEAALREQTTMIPTKEASAPILFERFAGSGLFDPPRVFNSEADMLDALSVEAGLRDYHTFGYDEGDGLFYLVVTDNVKRPVRNFGRLSRRPDSIPIVLKGED